MLESHFSKIKKLHLETMPHLTKEAEESVIKLLLDRREEETEDRHGI